MTIISRLGLIAAVAAVGIASPAFAEFFDAQEGTGAVVPFSSTPTAPHNDKMTVRHNSHGNSSIRRSGIDAFGMVPGPQTGPNSNDPALTGGGSLGYNQMLLQY
jgi:hypothetical protein